MPSPQLLTAERLEGLRVERMVQPQVAANGRAYLSQGRVSLVSADQTKAQLTVRGMAPRPYRVDVAANPRGGVNVECTCPAFDYALPCKHIVAGLLFLEGYLKRNPPQTWRSALEGALRVSATAAGPAVTAKRGVPASSTGRSVLFFSLQERTSGRWGVYMYGLPVAKLSEEARERATDPDALRADAMRLSRQAAAVRGAAAERYANRSPALERLIGLFEILQQGYNGYVSYASATNLRHLLPLLPGCPVYVGDEQDPLQTPIVVEPAGAAAGAESTTVRAALRVENAGKGGDGGGLSLTTVVARFGDDGEPVPGTETPVDLNRDEFVSEAPPWLLARPAKDAEPGTPATLVCLEEAPPAFLRLAAQGEIAVPAAERGAFFDSYLLQLAEQVPLLGGVVTKEPIDGATPPVPRLYLSETDRAGAASGPPDLKAALRFSYGGGVEMDCDPSAPTEVVRRKPGTESTLQRVRRDPGAEQSALQMLGGGGYGLKRDTGAGAGWGAYRLRARTEPADFLIRHVPRLAEAGFEIFGEESLRSVRVNRARPTLRFDVTSGIDWFDVAAVADFGGVTANAADLRGALRRRERFVKLADGSLGEIPEDWLARFRPLFALAEDGSDGAALRVSATQALLLEQAMADADGDGDADAEFARRVERLKNFERIAPRPLPEGLPLALYPYQKAGYDWLHFLHEYNFGGCLADDMGLGKTSQVLVFLESLRRTEPHAAPDLVVLPRSLLFNWQRESEKFTPGLRILVYADGDRPRNAADAFDGYDIVLTTYGILLRDIERLRKTRFHYAVLDEAQAIKNPVAQTARAARLLDAEHRLTLTGTPVENSSMELWSQFAFLNPGLLGSMERFREEFAGAIEKRQEEDAAKTLRKLVSPFLLRRTKEQVAQDLPPRTERSVLVEMEPAQRSLYDKLRDRYRAEVLGLLDEGKAPGRAQIAILEGLLRLRQVCCHPVLVEADYQGESGKMAALLETLETLQAEGHKALVFSQFTKMLGLVKDALDARKIPYAYLDGRTRDREARVDSFQNDPSLPFFLISLKAGGVGLNLTAADYVLHIDPWWNPAVEQQATDRAHRIGQDKPVFVYRFLVKDSVEEKILQLQERKRALVEQIISAESGFLKSLSRSDIESLFS